MTFTEPQLTKYIWTMNELEVKTEEHRIYHPNRGTWESEREQHAWTTPKLRESILRPSGQ